LLYLLGYVLNWFPINGGYDTSSTVPDWSPDFIFSAIQHGILPAFTIVISSIAGWLLSMRNTMITTLSEDYVMMAEAKGLSQRRIMMMYAARNAILPNITSFALSVGFVVSGALLTEIVFSYPGVGYALYQAAENLDYALLQGLFLIISIAVLGANFLADLLYVALDPRVRLGNQ
jgi:peptide/nickel transport system permease protein